jgi:hypothetical protein
VVRGLTWNKCSKLEECMGNVLEQWHAEVAAAKTREAERRARTGIVDPWWDAPHYVRAWLQGAEVTEDPEGNLIAAMRADPDIPHHFPSTKSLRQQGRCRGTAAALAVWRRYWQWGKRRVSPPLF